MLNTETKKYLALNKLAEQNGIVILGGTEDKDIPLCELKQAFDLETNLYNRSVTDLSVNDAADYYDACIAPLAPSTILLHIGEADLAAFAADSAAFDQKYRELITHIKTVSKPCEVAIISLKNPDNDAGIGELNRHLRYIAESEQCEFGDIATKRVWNPKETKDVVSFVHMMGFVRPLKQKRQIYDLVKIFFCYAPVCAG